MTNTGSPGPGWWQASDGNWYAPETHPDYVAPPQVSIPPSPAFEPPSSHDTGFSLPAPVPAQAQAALTPAEQARANQAAPNNQPIWKKWWVWALVVLAAALGGVAFLGLASSDSPATQQVANGEPTTESAGADGDTPDAEPTSQQREPRPTVEPRPTAEPGARGASAPGSLENPFGLNAAVPVVFNTYGDADGSVWNTMVGELRDLTGLVADASEYNDPPPDGIVFVGFDVEMTLARADKEPLAPGFNLTWELLGGESSSVYDQGTIEDLYGCGSFPNEFSDFAEVFIGGSLTGTVCIPLPVEDFANPDTRIAIDMNDGERIVFVAGGATPGPSDIASSGEAADSKLFAFDREVPVIFDSYGDADGSIWNTQVGTPRDMTAEIAGANDYNESPPDGIAFVGFDVELTLAQAAEEPLAPGFNMTWEILGGATSRVYGAGTIEDFFGCGSFDNELAEFAEVFVGGTLQGTVCIPLPIEDLEHPDTRVAMSFDSARAIFVPDGPSPDPVPLVAGVGPAGVGDSNPVDVATDIQWTTYGDADGSVWSTTVSSLSDITAQVADEASYNDEPPAGAVFAGFEVALTLVEADTEPLAVSFDITWEVLGGATNRVYDEGTYVQVYGCGAVPGEFDEFAEVLIAGSLAGTVCVPIPLEDLEHPDTRISLHIGEERVTFDPGN